MQDRLIIILSGSKNDNYEWDEIHKKTYSDCEVTNNDCNHVIIILNDSNDSIVFINEKLSDTVAKLDTTITSYNNKDIAIGVHFSSKLFPLIKASLKKITKVCHLEEFTHTDLIGKSSMETVKSIINNDGNLKVSYDNLWKNLHPNRNHLIALSILCQGYLAANDENYLMGKGVNISIKADKKRSTWGKAWWDIVVDKRKDVDSELNNINIKEDSYNKIITKFLDSVKQHHNGELSPNTDIYVGKEKLPVITVVEKVNSAISAILQC